MNKSDETSVFSSFSIETNDRSTIDKNERNNSDPQNENVCSIIINDGPCVRHPQSFASLPPQILATNYYIGPKIKKSDVLQQHGIPDFASMRTLHNQQVGKRKHNMLSSAHPSFDWNHGRTNSDVLQKIEKADFNSKRTLDDQQVNKRTHYVLSSAQPTFDWNHGDSDNLKNCFLSINSIEDILPMTDCRFLGEKLWIFTIQQLAYVLDVDLLPHHDWSEIAAKRSDARDDFDNALCQEYRDVNMVNTVVHSWTDALQQWKQVEAGKNQPFSTFSFSGPISYLTSSIMIDFLSQNKIYTAYEFLSIKKSESSSYVHTLANWRKQFGFESKLHFR